MNKSYLQADTAAWNVDGFMFGTKFLQHFAKWRGGGVDRAKFSGNIFASLKLIHMLKLKSNLGTYGIWYYQMGSLYLKHAVPPGLTV